jgi:hypothetical protein
MSKSTTDTPFMSYTQFVSTATLTLCDDFNVQSYLDAIAERCVKEENFLFEEYGEIDGKVDVDFGSYVHQNGNELLIETDTEEPNGNSEVWDWLIDQFIPIMKSEYVQIKSATIDSRSGVDIGFSLYSKMGKVVDLDEILKVYFYWHPVTL